jgi:uncharacterized protein YcbK (DUF882 family)
MLAFILRVGTTFALLVIGVTAASARPHSHPAPRSEASRGTRHHHGQHPRYAKSQTRIARHHRGPGGDTASRSCLTPDTRALLNRVEATFGSVQVISTCRPGAVVAGTGHASQHRYGRAVDFDAPPGRKAAIVQWLAANNAGGTMTYAHMGHIHMDTGPRHFVSLGSGGHGGHHVAGRGRSYAQIHREQPARFAAPAPRTNESPANPGYAANYPWGNGTNRSLRMGTPGNGAPPRHYAHHHRFRHERG